MIPARLLPLTVTWQQPTTTTDGYGNTVDDWTTPTSEDIAAYIEQRTTTENRDGRDVTVTRLLFITNELGVRATHRIIWDGRTYEIDGDCAVFHTPAGPHHSEATLLIVEG